MAIFKHRAAKKQARKCITEALGHLYSARDCPHFCCDVCGPYGHYFHLCKSASVSAVHGLLAFQGRTFEHWNLKRLVDVAFENVTDREHCMGLAARIVACPDFDPGDDTGPPTQTERDEVFRLAEELVLRVISLLPEDVRP